MLKRIFVICVILALMFCSFSVLADSVPVTVTDMFGRTVTLDSPVTRVIALTASDCEIICALGCEDLLVGRGAYCDYPDSVLSLPSVLSGSETNIEEILALEPQVVFMSGMAQTTEQVDQLEKNGVHVIVSDASDIEGVFTSIRLIGSALSKDEEAESLISDMQSAFASVSAASHDSGKTVYFEVSPLEWGLWTAGRNTFMDELANICGLKNAFSDIEGWAAISEEQILERNPDYIVTISMYFGEGPTPVEEILNRTGWSDLKAVKDNAVLNADSNSISRPGPRLKDAAMELYNFISDSVSESKAA